MKRGGFFAGMFFLIAILFFILIFLSGNFIFVSAANGITGFATEQNSLSNVSVTPFVVLADTFNGSTTNFINQNESTYRSFPNVTLEKTIYGKVEFNVNLDLVTMGGVNGTVNFDRDLNISDNLIYVDNANLPGIVENANLSLYGISFSSPQVMHNGVLCTDCTYISYSGGIYKFRVLLFSGPYYLRETPVSPVCGNGVIESGEECDD